MPDPLVSIIIPCFNMGELLSETLESVQNVYESSLHQVIVVNDGSTDPRTLEIFKTITQHQVVHKENGGLASARNAGISIAKGKYLLFLDADNLLTDGYLKKGVEVLDNHPEIDIVYGESEVIGSGKERLFTKPFDLQTLMSYNYIDACCLVRKRLFDDLGGFDENMKIMGYEDWEMWLRAALNHKKFFYMEGVIVQQYRVRNDSMLRKIDKQKRDVLYEHLEKKYPGLINMTGVSDFYYKKFDIHPIGWTAKLFIRKYFPSWYKQLIRKGKISRYL
ncbi:MAG: glycosyltransferase [Chitinophagaceae bacterium]|nr:glycosyltransferase [Chitinophagaceae bacterium]